MLACSLRAKIGLRFHGTAALPYRPHYVKGAGETGTDHVSIGTWNLGIDNTQLCDLLLLKDVERRVFFSQRHHQLNIGLARGQVFDFQFATSIHIHSVAAGAAAGISWKIKVLTNVV